MAKYNSGRQKKFNASGLTTDRYQFLGLEQAEPDLGDPLVGVSSVGAKPAPAGDQYLVIAVGDMNPKDIGFQELILYLKVFRVFRVRLLPKEFRARRVVKVLKGPTPRSSRSSGCSRSPGSTRTSRSSRSF